MDVCQRRVNTTYQTQHLDRGVSMLGGEYMRSDDYGDMICRRMSSSDCKGNIHQRNQTCRQPVENSSTFRSQQHKSIRTEWLNHLSQHASFYRPKISIIALFGNFIRHRRTADPSSQPHCCQRPSLHIIQEHQHKHQCNTHTIGQSALGFPGHMANCTTEILSVISFDQDDLQEHSLQKELPPADALLQPKILQSNVMESVTSKDMELSLPKQSSDEFCRNLKALRDQGWYWGPLTWREAEQKLENAKDGTFLVRDSGDEHYVLTLSFVLHARVGHVRMEHRKGGFTFGDFGTFVGCTDVISLVNKAMELSHEGKHLMFLRSRRPGTPHIHVRLLYPYSRFAKQRSLKHMCRFAILKRVRVDHIHALPLPTTLKSYLSEKNCFAED